MQNITNSAGIFSKRIATDLRGWHRGCNKLGDAEAFADKQAYSDWLELKRDAMETSAVNARRKFRAKSEYLH